MSHPAYYGFLAAGAAVGAATFLFAAHRAGLRIEWRLLTLTLFAVVCGMAGARLYAVIEQGGGWGRAAALDAGFRLPGAVIGMLVGFAAARAVLLPGIATGRLGDIGVIAVQFGLAVARLGCLAAGCCFGTVSSLPWAIRLPAGTEAAAVHAATGLIRAEDPTTLPVHPLQLYFMCLHLGLGLFLAWFAPRKAYEGQVLLLGLALGQTGKALLETFRQPVGTGSGAHLQVVSVVLAAGAAAALLGAARRRHRSAQAGTVRAAPLSG